MRDFTANGIINRARQICKYEPEFNYDEETGMIQIWDYSEDFEQAFHRENYCKANLIDLDELIKSINDEGWSYVTTIYEARDYKPTDNIFYLDGKECEADKNIIAEYIKTHVYSNRKFTDDEIEKIVNEVCFRMDALEVDSAYVTDFDYAEEMYTAAACQYIANHNGSVQALLDEEDDTEIFDYI